MSKLKQLSRWRNTIRPSERTIRIGERIAGLLSAVEANCIAM